MKMLQNQEIALKNRKTNMPPGFLGLAYSRISSDLNECM